MKLFQNTKLTSSAPSKAMPSVYGDNLDFSATEAYKLLRTNLMFSLPATERNCKIIGVTSAVRGEGKTTTCINLSYTLAETGKNVLLIDADLRLPSVAKALKLPRSPGLSNVLTGLSDRKITIQKSGLCDTLFVITSGDIPPNPSELLGAKSMETVIQTLTESFDYIVIDLPPVTVVSDALVISPLCDGVLLLVRQEYTARSEVSRAVELLTYCKAKLLGFVLNDTTAGVKSYHGKYGKYGKYGRYRDLRYGKKYGYNYGYRYGYDYAQPPTEAKDGQDENT